MLFRYTIQRTWLNYKRHKLTIYLTMVVLVALLAVVAFIYPGSTGVEAYMNIDALKLLLGDIVVEDPGLLVWLILLFNSLFLTLIFPIAGIFFGVRILPFNENDGKELIFSTEKSLLMYYFENLLLVFILIPLVALPAYLIGITFFLSSGDGILAFTIASILPLFFVLVVTMLTSFGCSINSSQKTGYAFGGIFFIFSFSLNLLQQEIEFAKDFNLMSQINSFQHALAGTWNENFIATCLVIIVILIILTIVFLYRTDYIETRKSYNEKDLIKNSIQKRGINAIFSTIRAPIESMLTRIGWRYPVFKDQLQSSAGIFLIYLCVTSFLMMLIALVYPGDETMALIFGEMESTLDSPIVAAFMFGHTLVANLEGFILVKVMLYNWIFYGPFLFIAAYDIIMRDRNAGYDEITWSMPRTRTLVIRQRTIAALVYLWIIVFANWIALWIGQIILSTYKDVAMTDFGATALAFIFIGIGYSLFLILFVTIALIAQPKYLVMTLTGVFFTSIFIPIIWYMNQDLTWILYLSPFSYFDVAGLLLNDIDLFGKVIPEIIAFGTISFVFYFTIIKFWAPNKDII